MSVFGKILNAILGIDLLLDADGDMSVSSDGDLSTTLDGRDTLIQDIRNGLYTLPGDLFAHADSGAGVKRLVGEDDADDIIERTIEDFLLYDNWVATRIKPESIKVKRQINEEGLHAGIYQISFLPIDVSGNASSNPLLLIWNVNTRILEML